MVRRLNERKKEKKNERTKKEQAGVRIEMRRLLQHFFKDAVVCIILLVQ